MEARRLSLVVTILAVAAFAISMLVPALFPGEDSWMGLPLAAVAPLWILPLMAALARGERWAYVLALAVLIFVTDSSFRARDWQDKSLDWQVLLKGMVWLGCGLAGMLRLPRTGWMLSSPPVLFTLFFLTWLLASALWSPLPLYTVQSAVAFAWLFLFGLAAAQVLDETQLLKAVALGTGLVVLPSLALAPFAMGIAPPSPGSTGEADRLRGFTDHPIPMAEVSALFTFACAALIGRVRGGAARTGLVALVAAGIATVLLTQSRIPPLSMLAAAFAFAAYRRGGWLLMLPALTVFVALVLVLESLGGFARVLPPGLLELVARSGESSEILTLSGRLVIWPYVLDRIAEAPLVGHGHATGMVLFESFTRWKITHAHNLYLQALLYVGIVGFGLLLAALLCQFRVFLRRPSPVRDILVLFTLLKGVTEQSILSNMPSGSVALWMVTVGMAAMAWGKEVRPSGRPARKADAPASRRTTPSGAPPR